MQDIIYHKKIMKSIPNDDSLIGDTTWDNTIQTDLSQSLVLRSLGIELPLEEVYEQIDF